MPSPDQHADDGPFDAAASLRVIREAQERARAANEPDCRLLYGVWGVAWLGGYLTLWTSARATGGQPEGWAFAVFGVLLLSAVVVTAVHSIRRTAGTRGVSARAGAVYGWSWFLGFVAQGAVVGGLAEAGASPEVMALAANGIACIVVGLLYLGGAIAFDDRGLLVLGVWILVVAAGATLAGLPGTFLIMALAGGGGFLLMAAVEHARVLRRRRGTAPAVPGTSRA
jgi:hypothetical protein